MKKYYWIIIGVVVLVLAAVGVLWYVDSTKIEEITPPVTNNSTSVATPSSQATTSATTKGQVESIKLKALGNYTGEGTATRMFKDGKFTHTVTTTLGNPATGKFYEGWLVNMSKTPPFFSTGSVENIDGVYELIYEASTDYSDYTMVVITEETSANGFDGVPEVHVLEGLF